jgi:hypothetical protein
MRRCGKRLRATAVGCIGAPYAAACLPACPAGPLLRQRAKSAQPRKQASRLSSVIACEPCAARSSACTHNPLTHLVELETVVPVIAAEEEGAAEGAQASVLGVPVLVVGQEGHLHGGEGEVAAAKGRGQWWRAARTVVWWRGKVEKPKSPKRHRHRSDLCGGATGGTRLPRCPPLPASTPVSALPVAPILSLRAPVPPLQHTSCSTGMSSEYVYRCRCVMVRACSTRMDASAVRPAVGQSGGATEESRREHGSTRR